MSETLNKLRDKAMRYVTGEMSSPEMYGDAMNVTQSVEGARLGQALYKLPPASVRKAGMVKTLIPTPVVGATMGAYEGASDAYQTPTLAFAQRNGLPMPESTAGQLGMRTLGTLQNVGNSISLGAIGNHFWPQVEGDLSNERPGQVEPEPNKRRTNSGGGASGTF